MSYHTRHLEPGDMFWAPADLDRYGYGGDTGAYHVWRVTSNTRDIGSLYGDCHIIAECLTDPALNLDCIVSGYISLCMIDSDEQLERILESVRRER